MTYTNILTLILLIISKLIINLTNYCININRKISEIPFLNPADFSVYILRSLKLVPLRGLVGIFIIPQQLVCI